MNLIQILGRRWYVFLCLLILAGAAIYWVNPRIGSQYQASGSLVIVPPNATTTVIGTMPTKIPTNPLLQSNQSNLMAAAVLAAGANSQQRQDELLKNYGLTYTATVDSPASLITVLGSASSQKAALGGVKAVLDGMQTQLADLQQSVGAPPDLLLQSREVALTQSATIQNGTRYKALFALGAAGLVLAVSMTLIWYAIAVAFGSRGASRVRSSRPATVSASVADGGGKPTGQQPHGRPLPAASWVLSAIGVAFGSRGARRRRSDPSAALEGQKLGAPPTTAHAAEAELFGAPAGRQPGGGWARAGRLDPEADVGGTPAGQQSIGP